MKTPNKFNNNIGILALITLVFIALACTFKTGGADTGTTGDVDSSSKSSIKSKKVKVDKDAIGLKKKDKSASSAEADEGDFVAVYSDIENGNYLEFDQLMQKEQMLEGITEGLNDALSLPEDIRVTFDDCGEPNAYYRPSEKSITVCYEMMDLAYKMFLQSGKSEEESMQLMFGATMFLFFHELGHALIDVYDLPATGREEDSVDQLSTYVLLDEMTEEGQTSAVAGILLFKMLGENQQMSAETFADEHSLNSVRYFNISCWMYGRDPQNFAGLVENGILPEKRAVRCEDEYTRMSNAWERLVKPWVKE